MVDAGLPITWRANATFSVTVLFGSNLKSWKTVPIWRRMAGIFQLCSLLSSRPATNTLPVLARCSRRISRKNVDLPDPDAPTRKTNSPLSMSTSMLSSAARR